jgi:NAD(P)-dependent dehydrogenase (short-subunit alcohol dehydrogenase family)
VLERRVECLQLVVSGYCPPLGQQDQEPASCSVDLLRRTMQDIPYSLVNLVQLVLPLLRKGSQKLMVVTTSGLGSIADNFTGRMVALRASTAALNQIVKCFAIEAESWNGTFVLLSPQRSEDADEESVQITAAKFVKTITQLTFKDNGTWINTQKQPMNW